MSISPADIRAASILSKAADDRVTTIRTRAEKWLPSLAALTTVVTTALIIKGADSFSKIDGHIDLPFVSFDLDAKATSAWLIGFALVGLLVATVSTYSAAYGSAVSSQGIDPDPIDLAVRYEAWKRKAEKSARRRLRLGVVLAALAALALALAVGVATFAPTSAGPAESICFYRGGGVVAQVPTPAQVVALPEGTTIGKC